MANATDVKIILDGYRNAKVRVTGRLDTSNLSVTTLITKALFTNNDPGYGALTGFRVDQVEFIVSGALSVEAQWEATTAQSISTFAGSGEICFKPGLIPDKAAAGYTGSIQLYTSNWAATIQTFTLNFNLIKLY